MDLTPGVGTLPDETPAWSHVGRGDRVLQADQGQSHPGYRTERVEVWVGDVTAPENILGSQASKGFHCMRFQKKLR